MGGVAVLVGRLGAVVGREVERGEGRRVWGLGRGRQDGGDAGARRGGGGVADALAVAQGRRQKSDYGQAVCTGRLRARQGAGSCGLAKW